MDWKAKSVALLILVISIAGVVGGYYQNSYLTEAGTLKDETVRLQTTLDRVEAKALYLVRDSVDRVYLSSDYLYQAQLLDMELFLLNNTLSAEQRDSYLYRIIELLKGSQSIENTVQIVHIYKHFSTSNVDYVIATEENEGYDYRITLTQYEEYVTTNGPLCEVKDAEGYYGSFMCYDMIQALPEYEQPKDLDSGLPVFVRHGGGIEGKADYFFYNPVRELQDTINGMLESANALDSQAQRISLGVSLATIGVVLATAVENRMGQRRPQGDEPTQSHIRHDEKNSV